MAKPALSRTARTITCLLSCWLGLVVTAVAVPPPTITLQPTNQTVAVGGIASFTVSANGNGTALSYQWYFGSNAIPGATNNTFLTNSTYTVVNAQPTNAGLYYVAVQNGGGTVNSTNVTLTVNGTIVVDNSTSAKTNGTTLSWSHTVGNGTNRILIVGVANRDGTKSIASVSYGAQNLTSIGSQAGGGNSVGVALYQLLNPPVGAATVTVVFNSAVTISAGAVSFTGVSQMVPLGTFASAGGTSSSGSVNVSSGINEFVVDIMGATGDGLSLTPGGAQAQRWNLATGTAGGDVLGGGSTQNGTPVTTMSWTLGASKAWAIGAVSLNPYFAPITTALNWNTFFGNNGIADQVRAIAVDTNGNLYVTGTSGGTWGSPLSPFGSGSSYAFVAKLNSNGNLIWNTFLGADYGSAITVDGSGNVFVSGYSTTNWGSPVRAFGGGGQDAYVAKLNGNGSLAWNTFLGGSGTDSGNGIAVDGSGNVYVTGYSTANWGAPQRAYSSGYDAFAAKLNSSGGLTWNTFLGQSGTDTGSAITADGSGNAYVAGWSDGTWGSPMRAFTTGSSRNGFVAKLNSTGSNIWNTFLGGSGLNTPNGISVDGSGNVFVAGVDTVTWGTPVQAFSGNNDAFAVKLNSSGALTWNTFLGGSGMVGATGVAIDGNGNVFVAGNSDSTWGTPARAYNGGSDVFTAQLNSNGTLVWNTFLGGSGTDYGDGIATDGSGNLYVAGTSSASWGSPLNAFGDDVFVARLGPPITDVRVTQAGSGSVFATSNLTYTVTVTNLGPNTASGLLVSDVLPSNSTFVSASGGGTNANGLVNWTLTGFTNTATTNFTVTVTAPPSGTLSNVVSGTAASYDPNPANNNGSATNAQVITLVTPLADIVTTVTGPASVFAATNYSYTILVTNQGPSTASDVVVSNILPSGVAFVSASAGGANNNGVVTWPALASLVSGVGTNFSVSVIAPASGTLTNTVSSSAATSDPNVTNNNGSVAAAQVVSTVVPLADIAATQSGPTSVYPFLPVTYTVTVSNLGPSTASNVVVSDTLASKFNFVSASAGGTYMAGVVTWPTLASLPVGATTNFTVTVTPPSKGTLVNAAASTSATADPNTFNNDGSGAAAQVTTTVTSLKVANTSSGASVTTLNWSHTVSPGSGRVLIVGVSIDAPSNTVIAATFANFLPLTLIGQTNGAQTKVAMYYLINPPVGTFPISINLTTASGIVGGAVSFNGVDQLNPIAAFAGNTGTGGQASVTVASALGGMVVDTVAPKSPKYAQSADAAQTVAWNLSSSSYAGAGSTSPGAALVSPSWTLNGNPSWAMGAVALNPATLLADITLTATGPSTVLATSNLTYTLTVTNLGTDSATNLVVSDVLPAGATFVSASSGGSNNAGVVSWPALTNFVSGAKTNYTLTITATANGSLTNIAYSTASTADPDPSNNNGTGTNNQVVTTIAGLADIATTVNGPAAVVAGANYSYTVLVTNQGPSTAGNVVAGDTLPPGVAFVSASAGGTLSGGVVTWPALASLPSGTATNFTVTVIAPVGGALTNTVFSTAFTSDPNFTNNNGAAAAAQVVTTVYPRSVLAGKFISNQGYQVQFGAPPNTLVTIEASTNLVDWQILVTTNSGNGSVTFLDQSATNYPRRYYRTLQ